MKRILLSSVVVRLLLAGCRDSDENRDLEDTTDEIEDTTEEIEDTTEEVEDVESPEAEDEIEKKEETDSNTLVGTITDFDPIPLEDYDAEEYKYMDTSSLVNLSRMKYL